MAERASGGKYSKRPCPALNGWISPGDCGAQRGSKLECPETCPFFPFGGAAHDLWLKADHGWSTKSLEYIARHLSEADFRELVQRLTIPMRDQRLELECAVQNAVYYALFIQPDPAGKRLVEKWEAEQWAGLNNDERVMMRYRRHGRPTVIEVRRVLDAQTVECGDALVPDAPPFRLLDRGVAAQTVRFTRVFTWLFRYPHFCRVGANAIELPFTIWSDWRAAIDERHQRARETRPDLALADFLAETVAESATLITALSDAYRDRMLANLDLYHCVTLFRYSCPPSELETIFQGKPDFVPADEPRETAGPQPLASYTWLRQGESAAFEQEPPATDGPRQDASGEGGGVLGQARVFAGHVMFETLSKRKYAFMRQMVDRYFGPRLTFDRESVRDFATIMAERERRERTLASAQHRAYGQAAGTPPETEPTPPDVNQPEAEAIPPEVRRQALAEKHLQHYRTFLDESVPALSGLTPRAAAADPEKRPLLVELMKQHLNGLEQRNRDDGLDLKLDWLLEELNLRELS